MRLYVLALLYLPFLTIPTHSQVASAQTIVVRMMNGKNRKPLTHYRVYIVLGDPHGQHSLDLMSDREGKVQFDAGGVTTFQVRPVGTVTCGEQRIGAPIRDYSVAEVLAHGIVTRNDCGDFNPEPVRGQLVYLARSATWLDLFRN
jgi:hypothetical protein